MLAGMQGTTALPTINVFSHFCLKKNNTLVRRHYKNHRPEVVADIALRPHTSLVFVCRSAIDMQLINLPSMHNDGVCMDDRQKTRETYLHICHEQTTCNDLTLYVNLNHHLRGLNCLWSCMGNSISLSRSLYPIAVKMAASA